MRLSMIDAAVFVSVGGIGFGLSEALNKPAFTLASLGVVAVGIGCIGNSSLAANQEYAQKAIQAETTSLPKAPQGRIDS